MSWKRPVVFLALAAAMVAFILVERFVLNPERPASSDATGLILPKIKEHGGLAGLRVTIKEGKKVEFEHDGTSWRMTMPLSLRADESAVNPIADALERLKFEGEHEIVRAEEGKTLAWRDYGLDPPAFEAEAETKQGVRLRLHVGAKVQLGRGKIYVRVPDEEVAYLVADDLRDALDREFNEFRDRHVLDFAKHKVERIEATEPEGGVVLVRRPDPAKEGAFLETWNLERPVRDRADKGHAGRVLDRLSWLEVTPTGGFVANEYDEKKNAARYGFEEPARAYTLFLTRGAGEEPEKQKLLVGKTVEGRPHQRYVLRAGMPFVLAVSEQKLKEIVPDLKDLRETHLLSFSTSQVTKVTVERAGVEKPLVLERVEEKPEDLGEPLKVWKILSPVVHEADKSEVEDLLGQFARAKIEAYHADGVEPAKMAECGLGEAPAFKLTIEREKEEALVMHFGRRFQEKNKHLLYAARPEFPNVYAVSGKLAELLASRPLDLRSRQVWAFDRADYNRIAIERWRHRRQKEPPGRYEIEKDEDGRWHLKSPVKEEANRGVCDEILARLSDLKVRRFLTESAEAKELKENGLDPPAVRIEIAQVGVEGTKRRVVRLSEQDERSRIAKGVVEDEKGPTGLVWELEDWNARPLFGDPVRKQILDVAKDDMRRVEVSLRGGRETYTIERAGEEWKAAKPREQYLDQDAADKLLTALYYLVAERVADAKPKSFERYTLGKRAASRFKVSLADGTARELELSLSSADNQNNRFARTPDRESVFVIARDKAEALEKTLKDLGASDTPVVKEEEVPAWAPPRVGVRTRHGAFLIELFENDAPNTVANFITLVEKKFYDGLTFHRVENWVVQGGDAGPDKPEYCIPFEHRRRMREHDYGAVGMALLSGKPNSGDSQFYVVKDRKGAHHLDTKHVVFGRVLKGMEVVERIEQGDKILSARVVHKPAGRTYEVREKIQKKRP